VTNQRSWVVIGSSNGSSNYGDDMMWLAMAVALRNFDPGCRIVTDAGSDWIPPLDNISVLPFIHRSLMRFNMSVSRLRLANRVQAAVGLLVNRGALERGLKRQEELAAGAPARGIELLWEREIVESAGLVFSGAGGLTDRFAVHAVAGWGVLTALAKRNGVRVAYFGQGVGPLEGPDSREALARTFGRADLVTTRDLHSAEEVRLLAPGTHAVATIDWAVLERLNSQVESRIDRYLDAKSLTRYIAVSLHDWTSASAAERASVSALLGRLAEVARAIGCKVVLVPNCVGLQRADDRQFMLSARSALQAHVAENIVPILEPFDAFETRRIIARSLGVFSSRYHPVVFGLAEGTPATGICYDQYYLRKHFGALEWYGEGHRIYEVGATPPSVEWWLDGVELERERQSERLRRTDVLRASCADELTAWLESVVND
jgi:polysaccharide pyruvyl transferase WcaK-like protein